MTDVKSIKDQFFVYHLTSAENLDSIFKDGLKPRASLTDFTDVSDEEILSKRKALGLDAYVPFHWFAGNPFDGRVQRNRPESKFVLITVYRSFAKSNGWKVIPHHPLADEKIELLSYDAGFDAINWDLMDARDYHDAKSKRVCMAECLSPGVVHPIDFSRIYVPNNEVKQLCEAKLKSANLTTAITVSPGMFYR